MEYSRTAAIRGYLGVGLSVQKFKPYSRYVYPSRPLS